MDGPSESREAHHLDTSNVLPVSRLDSRDKRTCYVPCLKPFLTVWADPVTTELLPDYVLLHIIHFVRVTNLDRRTFPNGLTSYYGRRDLDLRTFPNGLTSYYGRRDVDEWRLSWWRPLIHVCQKWRSVVFGSPTFLDLKLVCVSYTRVELIDIWPSFPIIIRNEARVPMSENYDLDAVIVHRSRVCEIDLYLKSSQLQRLASAMQEPFPALIGLALSSRPAQALPDGFLGGSAPRLKFLHLHSISFHALPKLLLSTTDLSSLSLENIPHTGYILPEMIVSALAVLINLTHLTVKFESHLSYPDRESRRLPPPICIVLPALVSFKFKGVSEYLEDLVARIDTPLLISTQITFFHQLIFSIPQLAQFMRRTTRLKAFSEARVYLSHYGVWVDFSEPPQISVYRLQISCTVLEWQLSSLGQVFTSLFPSISVIEHLYVNASSGLPSKWQDDVEDTQWLEIFYPFTVVKNLYVSKEFLESISLGLKDLFRERVIHVLPALESLFLEGLPSTGPVRGAIEQFVAARQLLDHPVAISSWDSKR